MNLDSSREACVAHGLSALGPVGGHIVAMGGGGFYADPGSPLDDYMLSLSPSEQPRVCLVPTPGGDSDRGIALFFEAFSRRECVSSCLRLFGVPDGRGDPAPRASGLTAS